MTWLIAHNASVDLAEPRVGFTPLRLAAARGAHSPQHAHAHMPTPPSPPLSHFSHTTGHLEASVCSFLYNRYFLIFSAGASCSLQPARWSTRLILLGICLPCTCSRPPLSPRVAHTACSYTPLMLSALGNHLAVAQVTLLLPLCLHTQQQKHTHAHTSFVYEIPLALPPTAPQCNTLSSHVFSCS